MPAHPAARLGLAWRHFYYVPEITLGLAWRLPAGFTSFVPYFHVTFLTILLLHRAMRDDKRCLEKYGEYRKHVP